MAAATRIAGQGHGARRFVGGGKHRQLFVQLLRMALRALGQRARAHQGFKGMAAVLAGVFVDGHRGILLVKENAIFPQ